jgi:hypothetical protein
MAMRRQAIKFALGRATKEGKEFMELKRSGSQPSGKGLEDARGVASREFEPS